MHEQLPSTQPVANVDTSAPITFPAMPRPLPFSLLYGSSETAAGSSENRGKIADHTAAEGLIKIMRSRDVLMWQKMKFMR